MHYAVPVREHQAMSDDPELARWRAQRMAQMQEGIPAQGNAMNAGRAQQEAEQRRKQQAMEEQRRMMLKQILSNEASERLSRVKLVKPEKAHQVESYIIDAARSGRLPGKVNEDQLKDLLQQVSAQTEQRTKVTISRRRGAFDDDDDDDDDL